MKTYVGRKLGVEKKNKFIISLFEYLTEYPPARLLIEELLGVGKIYFIGGVLREFRDNGCIKSLRDIDMVIDGFEFQKFHEVCEKYDAKKNQFDGFKMYCSGLELDVWSLNETWAFRKGIIKCSEQEYLQRLQDTVFLNMDAIIYDVQQDQWYEHRYLEAMHSKQLEIVLKDNPKIELNILRAMIIKKKYNMKYSLELLAIMKKFCDLTNVAVDSLYDIQIVRYHRQLLSKEQIEAELRECRIT